MQGARGDRAVLRATAPVCGQSHAGESVGTLGKHYTAQDKRGDSGALQDEQLQLLLQQAHVTRDVFAAAKKVRGRTATLPQGGQAALDAMAAPTAPGTARSTASKKKKKAAPPDPLLLASAVAKSETLLPPNLQQIADVFRACASGTGGTLSPNDVGRALELLDVADPAVAEAFVNVVDVHQDRSISLEVIVAVLDTALNHPGAVKPVRDACFSLFNVDQQGYIHRPHLIELKSSPGADARAVAQKITPGMVKVLFDLFTELRRLEEEAYVLNVLCKGKKKKKLPPMPALANTYIPTTLRRIEHINADSFAQYFDKWPAIAAAFTSVWLNVALRDVVLHQNLIVRSVAAGKCKEALLQEERAAAAAKAQQNEAEKK
jgi:Ca2+-binding EF-hand superfamily protein